jgi:hypothetical protein
VWQACDVEQPSPFAVSLPIDDSKDIPPDRSALIQTPAKLRNPICAALCALDHPRTPWRPSCGAERYTCSRKRSRNSAIILVCAFWTSVGCFEGNSCQFESAVHLRETPNNRPFP